MARKLFVLMLAVLSLLCAGCDVEEEDVKEFLDTNPVSEKIHDTVTDAAEGVEDYVEEMASDAIDMTGKLTEGNLPDVSPETSQDIQEGVIDALDDVGQVVLTIDAKAQALQECAAMCNFAFEDDAGHKTENNLLCIAQCRSQ